MKIVALVLAGGEGTRLYPLTADHAKPALPFANGYRICDFVLSNLVNSGISTIYVLAQYKPESLMKHIQTAWAPWFDQTEGLIKVLLPRANTLEARFKGTADAVYQYLDIVQAHAPDIVAVFAADHVYRMDIRQMIDFHRTRNAAITVSALAVPLEAARSFGVLKTAADGRVIDFREKPKQPSAIPGDPRHAYASMGNYLFEPAVLERELLEARERGEVDFGRDVLPRACRSERIYAYDFGENRVPGVQEFEERCYWRDVGTLSALAAAQQDAMGTRPRFNLWNSRWPIHGEYEAAMLARTRIPETEEALKAPAAWRGARRDRHTDERVQPS
ncbi:MAG TPA: sugar phosphate nucleotidyltransferase [Burkholderiales bacterium]|jgi:glucose-1-phosphate adenylyltransferase|nr:sugar phosphate nucleotidyltransferase [Burkholderiales bacterium]